MSEQEIISQPSNFRLENILVKNLSLEIPKNVVTPSFSKDPTVQFELRNSSRPLSRDNYAEVLLEGTVRVRNGDEDLQLLIEVSQAGIFMLDEPDSEKRQRLLNIRAPEALYPYLSQLVADLMMRAGSPRIFLPPFNFESVYDKKRELLQKKMAEEENAGGNS